MELTVQAGFGKFEYLPTNFRENNTQIEQPKEVFGEESFVIIKVQ